MVIFPKRWDGNVFFPLPLNVFSPDLPLTLIVFQWFSQTLGAMVNDGFDQ